MKFGTKIMPIYTSPSVSHLLSVMNSTNLTAERTYEVEAALAQFNVRPEVL
jgi:hypothetical protein